jgi:hypothetical protein
VPFGGAGISNLSLSTDGETLWVASGYPSAEVWRIDADDTVTTFEAAGVWEGAVPVAISDRLVWQESISGSGYRWETADLLTCASGPLEPSGGQALSSYAGPNVTGRGLERTDGETALAWDPNADTWTSEPMRLPPTIHTWARLPDGQIVVTYYQYDGRNQGGNLYGYAVVDPTTGAIAIPPESCTSASEPLIVRNFGGSAWQVDRIEGWQDMRLRRLLP